MENRVNNYYMNAINISLYASFLDVIDAKLTVKYWSFFKNKLSMNNGVVEKLTAYLNLIK